MKSYRYDLMKFHIIQNDMWSPTYVVNYNLLNKINLYKEWSIWSKCFGKIIVINGTSSAGKSTLCKYLSSKHGFNLISLDHVVCDIYTRHVKRKFLDKSLLIEKIQGNGDFQKFLFGLKMPTGKYTEEELTFIKKVSHRDVYSDLNLTKLQEFEEMYNLSRKFIFSGQNVILDIVNFGDDTKILNYAFMNYPMTIGLLYTPLEETLKKYFYRNYLSFKEDGIDLRPFSHHIVLQYKTFYEFVPENIIPKYSILGRTSKNCVKNLLDMLLYYGINFLKNLGSISYDEKWKNDYSNNLYSLIKDFKTKLVSDNLFIIPNPDMEYDFVVNSNLELVLLKNKFVVPFYIQETFKNFNKEFLGTTLQVIKKQSMIVKNLLVNKYSFIEHKCIEDIKSNLKTIEKRDFQVILDELLFKVNNNLIKLNEVADLLGITFIVYKPSQLTLPDIVGNNGPILEIESYENKIYNLVDLAGITDNLEECY